MANIDQRIKELESEKGAFWLPDGVQLPPEFVGTKKLPLSFLQGFHDGAQARDNPDYVRASSEETIKAYGLGYDKGKQWRTENE